jgi:hypothetical protein
LVQEQSPDVADDFAGEPEEHGCAVAPGAVLVAEEEVYD